jgi:hypothetical protein
MSVQARLGSFLPDLKAANDALPSDASSIQIEAPEDATEYIEMDLGLGVLEEQHDETSSDESVQAADEDDILGKLLRSGGSAGKPSIVEMTNKDEKDSAGDGSASDQEEHEEDPVLPKHLQLTVHPALEHYRLLAHIDHRLELEIVLSLMTRALKQLVKRPGQSVATTTQLNVLQEDMLKLMERRDSLLRTKQRHPKHETTYLDELDKLLQLVHN